MRGKSVFPFTVGMGLAIAILMSCAPMLMLTGIGFHIGGWDGWARWASSEWQAGHRADVAIRIGEALPGKITCGARWAITEPQVAYASQLEQQGRYEEAVAVCQRAAQATLACAPTSSRYTRCFEINRQILRELCLQTCDVVTCRAARATCTQ